MSVLCCRIPDFILGLTLRRRPAWRERPLALLGPDESIWVVSEEARCSGIRPQMQPRQAQMRCPDILLQTVDLRACQDEQAALLAVLARWQLPVEPLSWGLAYLDLTSIARTADDVRPLAAELGQTVRNTLGDMLQPSLGWDSGKFTARAAAMYTRAGRIRLVDKPQEVAFLAPLPITLLPLPPAALQQLHWLGIRTMGQFAALPAAAVWQRFGRAGKLAQHLAQGRDDRPVWNGLPALPAPVEVDIDPPTGLLSPVVEGVIAALRPHLAQSADRLQGWRRLRLQLRFVDDELRTLALVFVEPVCREERLRATLTAQLSTLDWPAELSFVRATIQEVSELPAQQLTLFPDGDPSSTAPDRLAATLAGKYGPLFFYSAVVERSHPVAERRSRLRSTP